MGIPGYLTSSAPPIYEIIWDYTNIHNIMLDMLMDNSMGDIYYPERCPNLDYTKLDHCIIGCWLHQRKTIDAQENLREQRHFARRGWDSDEEVPVEGWRDGRDGRDLPSV